VPLHFQFQRVSTYLTVGVIHKVLVAKRLRQPCFFISTVFNVNKSFVFLSCHIEPKIDLNYSLSFAIFSW
jgi:hypothetical protein